MLLHNKFILFVYHHLSLFARVGQKVWKLVKCVLPPFDHRFLFVILVYLSWIFVKHFCVWEIKKILFLPSERRWGWNCFARPVIFYHSSAKQSPGVSRISEERLEIEYRGCWKLLHLELNNTRSTRNNLSQKNSRINNKFWYNLFG